MNGFAEIVKAYGDPRDYIGGDGLMSHEEAIHWELHLRLVFVKFPSPLQLSFGRPGQLVHAMRCHPAAADGFRAAFRDVHREGLWYELRDYGGCFMVRAKSGDATELSTHSWAIAADFGVRNNPRGVPPRMNLAVVQIFESHGFVWGGRWRVPDGMHFQACSGY